MDAIVLAGGRLSPDDPLARHAPDGVKCLVEVAGRPLIQWTLDALDDVAELDRVLVIGLPDGVPLRSARPLQRLPAERDMIASLQAAADLLTRDRPEADHALVVAGDAPLVDATVLRWAVAQIRERDPDVALCAVERSVMEARFPRAQRTYVRLADAELCGGDVAAFRVRLARTGQGVAEQLSRARKQPWRLALVIGPSTLLALLLRRLPLADAERRIGRRLGLRTAVLVCPYAEVAMDVDKPTHLALVRDALATQAGGAPAARTRGGSRARAP